MKSKINLENAVSYIQGNLRYKCYYSNNFKWLIRKHIKEQIKSRIISMNKTCYLQGSCTLCGCLTTALQMCNKPCDKPCYPKLMSKKEWRKLKGGSLFNDNSNNTTWSLNGELKFVKRRTINSKNKK